MKSLDSDVPLSIPACLIALIITVCLLFVSCGKRENNIKNSAYKHVGFLSSQKNVFDANVQLAKFNDVPVPVGFQVLDNSNKLLNLNNRRISFVGDLDVVDVIDFYRQSIDGYGWNIQDFSVSEEGLFYCSKLGKNCVVSVRTNENRSFFSKEQKRTVVSVFIQEKKGDTTNSADINVKQIPVDLKRSV